MKFKGNRSYNLFGYDVKLIDCSVKLVDCGDDDQVFLIAKGNDVSKIAIIANLSFLKNMDSTETRRLELLFRDLENYAKYGESD